MQLNNLPAALALRERGMALFPCLAGKKIPLTKRGHLEATTDEEIIGAWWGPDGWPAANIAIATGEVSGVVVVDIDVKGDKDGEADLRELELEHGALPATVEARTPSSGRHLYFSWPGFAVPCSVGKIAAGIDLRADGGYVLCAPSRVVENGIARRYVWSANSAPTFAPLPEWLLTVSTAGVRRPPGYFAEIAGGVNNGCRNASLASLCGKLLRSGMTPSQAYEYLTFWNTKNNPPLEDAVVETAVLNIGARELRKQNQ